MTLDSSGAPQGAFGRQLLDLNGVLYQMGIIAYALMAYALTAVISLGVVAIIVVTNKVMNKKEKGAEQ